MLASSKEQAESFYVRVMQEITRHEIPFLVGGFFAMKRYTGIDRPTKDLDLFFLPTDIDRVLTLLVGAGFSTERTEPIWLAKVYQDENFVDLVYRSGNGVSEVDQLWFEHANSGTVFGQNVLICPPEETLWSKAFTMERERYDGADVLHLIRACGSTLDWNRLLSRFGEHWQVLLSYLVLFEFVYPTEPGLIPRHVWKTLLTRRETNPLFSVEDGRLCKGPLLSRKQFEHDIVNWGYRDGRFIARGTLTENDIEEWRKTCRPATPQGSSLH